jgi:hypothetical protein
MAIQTPTTTGDLKAPAESEPRPVTEAERVEQIVELTDPAVVADVKAPKTVKVTSPHGFVTEVPESVVDALVESGYSKSK